MVSFTSAALLSLAAVGALAVPHSKWGQDGDCMTLAEAQQVADNYAELIRNYTETLANEALAVDFTDYSESVNTLINTCPQGSAAVSLPLLSPTFSNRAAFELGQGQQPAINFQQLNLHHSCKSVTLRWETTNTAPIPTPRPVVGIILIMAEKAAAGSKFPWIVQTVYSEFDSGAWLQNLEQAGICQTPNLLPSGTPGAPLPPTSSATAVSPPTSTVATSGTETSTPAGYSTTTSTPVAYTTTSTTVAPAGYTTSAAPTYA